MRDMLVCRDCPKFIRGHIMPFSAKHDGRWFVLSDTFLHEMDKYFHRQNCCELDDFLSRDRSVKPDTEYYRLGIPSDCPYRVEHEMYTFNADSNKVDYGILRHFRRKRVCQHCGREIPNMKKCPVCGFDRFGVYSPVSDRAWVALFMACFLVSTALVVAFVF